MYYNDPVELVDPKGRVLGISSRSPYSGHLATDGHSGPLVFVMERHKSRLQNISSKFKAQEMRMRTASSAASIVPTSLMESPTKQAPMKAVNVEICGGERLRIPGLVRVPKKQFPGGCIVQHQFFADSSRASLVAADIPYLTCEVVLTSAPTSTSSPPKSSILSTQPSQSQKNGKAIQADRTATGQYVGVLYAGVLHRQAEHTKLWRKRFFVLTQVALHRFPVSETLSTIKNQKPTGTILLQDCRAVRYEKFSRPHELEIKLLNGKLFQLHAVDAITCANWASVLTRAIENPQWVHAEQSYVTIWRSDSRFESPRCPKITKIVLRRGGGETAECVSGVHSKAEGVETIVQNPRWCEKISLGSVKARGVLVVQLDDGHAFRLTLEDLTQALQHASWVAVSTSLEVSKIHSLAEDEDGIPNSLMPDMPIRKSDLGSDDSSQFIVRLKFRSDLHLDRRLTKRSSYEYENRLLVIVASALVVLPAFMYGHTNSMNFAMRAGCLVFAIVTSVMLIAIAPVVWHVYLWYKYDQSMEAELHWFLTLLAIEVRPQSEKSERASSSSGEDSRLSRAESIGVTFLDSEDGEPHADGSIVVPTRPPGYNAVHVATVSAQSIRTFRLENALDSILARPQFSFFAIKRFFPTRFLPRDAAGRRVLLISLNAVNCRDLAAHNISSFNIGRFFLYLSEFIWSYQDNNEGVAKSDLVLIVDCRSWHYFKWFGVECHLLMQVLNRTNQCYPGRLAKVVFVHDKSSLVFYRRFLARFVNPAVRAVTESSTSLTALEEYKHDAKDSPDELALKKFVTNLLATYANVTIPSFTRRELEQAARIAKTGAFQERDNSDASAPAVDSIGTRAVLLPDNTTLKWNLITDDDQCSIYRSEDESPLPIKGKMYQSDARVGQWRGKLKMKTENIESLQHEFRNPSNWIRDEDDMKIIDKLSRNEDIAFWSRRVPFMSFSVSGHRRDHGADIKKTNAFFECAVRRIDDMRPGAQPHTRQLTVMWKTTFAQRLIVNRPVASSPQDAQDPSDQWRKLEDPFVSLCFVVEEAANKQLTMHFWFQSFAPPATPEQTRAIANLLRAKLEALDKLAMQRQ